MMRMTMTTATTIRVHKMLKICKLAFPLTSLIFFFFCSFFGDCFLLCRKCCFYTRNCGIYFILVDPTALLKVHFFFKFFFLFLLSYGYIDIHLYIFILLPDNVCISTLIHTCTQVFLKIF